MRKKKKVQVRRLRHWKQRFKPGAKFIWRTCTIYAGKKYLPGDTIPKDLDGRPTKLRRFWESRRIELAEFGVPDVATGQVAKSKKPVKPVKPVKPAKTDNDDWLGEED